MKYLDILVRLRKVVRSINLESKRIEKQFGVSIPQLLFLQFLSEQEDYKASAGEIKDYLHLNASTISGIMKRLESKGMIARLPKLDDKRVTYLTLTAKGADLLRDSPTTLQEKLAYRISRLSSERVLELGRNIDLLIEIMDAKDLDASPVVTINEIGNPG